MLYGTWSGFEKQLVFPVIEGPYPLRCVLCAASISSAPYFTAFNHTGYRWEICCSCVAAMGVRVSSSSSVVRIPAVDGPAPRCSSARVRCAPQDPSAVLPLLPPPDSCETGPFQTLFSTFSLGIFRKVRMSTFSS